MYFVYIIECVDGSLYTGTSPDSKARFLKHKAGLGAKYTKAHLPLKLVYTESFEVKGDAMRKEIEIKSWQRKKKLDLINKD